MTHRKKTIWNGIEYDSRRMAADENFLTPAAMRYRLKQGYTCDDDMETFHTLGNPVTYQGVHYRSLSRCASLHLKSDYAMSKLIAVEKVKNAK